MYENYIIEVLKSFIIYLVISELVRGLWVFKKKQVVRMRNGSYSYGLCSIFTDFID